MTHTAITRVLDRRIGWGLAGLSLTLLLGIVGMHGIGSHGVDFAAHYEAGVVAGGNAGVDHGGTAR